MFKSFRSRRKLNEDTQAFLGDGAIDPKVQEALLSNPRVQEAMKKSGEQALSNPAVQEEIAEVAKENLTAENAAKIANACKEWAQDPEVRAKARHYAGMAMECAGQAGQGIVGCIEQGPDGVRYLCSMASLFSIGFAVYATCLQVLRLNLLFAFMGGFQILFAFTTFVFEAKPEHIEKYSLNKYQDMLMEYAKFISTVLGRGFFYIYQGMLWFITVGAHDFADWIDLFNLASIFLGVFLLVMGGLHVAMHHGVMPQEVVVKVREAAAQVTGSSGYQKVETESP